jgi:hypothetical protein
MSSSVHTIERYSVQVLNQRSGRSPRPSIIVRLYDGVDVLRGTAVFKAYDEADAEPPTGDPVAETALAYYDITFYDAFIGILRAEDELYWKIAWVQLGANREVSDVSLDTKKEIIGEFFSRPSPE